MKHLKKGNKFFLREIELVLEFKTFVAKGSFLQKKKVMFQFVQMSKIEQGHGMSTRLGLPPE